MLRIASFSASAAVATTLMFAINTIPAAAAGSPLGVWIDDTGRGAVEISHCGGALCGRVVWVKSKSDTKGCGAKIMGGVKAVGAGNWDNGWIYSPEHGRKFDVALTPVGANRLRVTGYAGVKLFSQNHMWTRASADLPRCDEPVTPTTTAVNAAPAAKPTPAATTTIAAKPPPLPTKNARARSEPAPVHSAASDKIIPPAPHLVSQPPTSAHASTVAANIRTANGATRQDRPPASAGPSFDKLVKRTADGACKLDMPWLKVEFDCEKL